MTASEDDISSSEYWQRRAKEARGVARKMRDRAGQQAMQQVTRIYDGMAEQAEQQEKRTRRTDR
jgi:hypothetical protein